MSPDLLAAIEDQLPPPGSPVTIYRASPEPWTRSAFLELCRVHSAGIQIQPCGITIALPHGVFVTLPNS